MSWDPPAGLPKGRLVRPDPAFARDEPVNEPVLWVSDEPAAQAARLWARLIKAHSTTGLWPLMLLGILAPEAMALVPDFWIRRNAGRPWHAGELAPVPVARVDALDPEEILSRWWSEVTGQGPNEPEIGDDVLPQQPFRAWPGLAPSGEPCSAGDADDEASDEATAHDGLRRLTGWDRNVYLGLVPAKDGAAALASCGWLSRRGHVEEEAAVVRSWQERFGARLCTLGTGTLALTVARPPKTIDHCRHVAAEHLAYSADAVTTPFDAYAAQLRNAKVWRFWWD